MKTAGNILSVLFDEQFVKKAQGYSLLFDSWADITAKNGIPAAADHSRIRDLDRGILLVETDHPGWKQILQTKQSKLLNDFRLRFPDQDISGISLILGRNTPQEKPVDENTALAQAAAQQAAMQPQVEPSVPEAAQPAAAQQSPAVEVPAAQGFDAIEDEAFKEMLKRLGQNVAAREK